jgi:hypothetical protein
MFIFPVAHTLAKFYLYEQENSRSTWHVRLPPRLHRVVNAQDMFRLFRQAGEQIIHGSMNIRGVKLSNERFDKIKEWRN